MPFFSARSASHAASNMTVSSSAALSDEQPISSHLLLGGVFTWDSVFGGLPRLVAAGSSDGVAGAVFLGAAATFGGAQQKSFEIMIL